ncbi:hypothetical protein SLNWT_6504 [Streptomyces albus]|uniref:SCO1431 family membrane protein n=1 Tax=Streptomyces albus (strain ATCC 21838 / DSM 41398 / FERM P-419 / JCM 4703 / NBRC 107858) TaxID=1081613 RepID=A0A0B5F5Q3_STRA4|nr:hypothetical protein SLNWT_6504 [Streptomyces albus]
MVKLSPASGRGDGNLERPGGPRPRRRLRDAMTSTSAAAARVRARTGGPKDEGPKVLEHVLGWTLVVVLAMLVTQAGLL